MVMAAAIEMGDPIPEDCIAPDIPPDCSFAHAAFSDLTTDRQIGMANGPIPWSSIDRYARRYNIISLDEFESFMSMIRAMDEAFLDYHSKKE